MIPENFKRNQALSLLFKVQGEAFLPGFDWAPPRQERARGGGGGGSLPATVHFE